MGNGTLADKLHDVISFVYWLGDDIITDCAQSPEQLEWHFWYIWSSDGANGFLLDFIQQPTQLELRLETYTQTQTPMVVREFLPLSDLSINGDTIQMGPLTLTNQTCTGVLNNSIVINVSFDMSARMNPFIAHMAKFIEAIIPDPFSHYGTVSSSSTVGDVTVTNGTALILTTYSMNLGIDIWRWVMLSTTFVGSGGGMYPDLQIEIIGFPGPDEIYMGTSYIYYQGEQYHLNDVFTSSTCWQQTGEITNGNRNFSALVQTDTFALQVTCFAPVSSFAVLDTYALSSIHTTVLGSCTAKTSIDPNTYTSHAALLELKAFQM